jgi:mycothiol synthase
MRPDRPAPTVVLVDIVLRGLDKADVPAWNRLLADVELVDRTGEHYCEADLVEEMDNPDLTPGKDIVGAFDGQQLVGYFCVYLRAAGEELRKIHLQGAVHPARRGQGLGTRLAAAMIERAQQAHTEQGEGMPALCLLSGLTGSTAQAELLAGVGLQPERWTFQMRARLTDLPEPPPMPARLEVRAYDAAMSGLLRHTHNDVFRDHPNFTSWTEVMWQQWVTGSRSFRPQHSFVVVDPAVPDRLAAYVQTAEYDAYREATGRREAYVAKVGTRREYRGQGVATALLQHCLADYRRAGFDEAALDVDSQNPTGALGVYERAGFEVELTRADYARWLG